MLINKSPVRLLEHNDITVRIYHLQQCYRVEVSTREGKLYWYPGVFRSEQELWDWFRPPLEALIEEGIDLSGKWMQSSEEELYQGWFVMKVITFTEARNKLKAVLDRVISDADYTIITRRDADDAVIMSLDYFNSLLETVHLLKSPANAAHLERSIAQYRQGQVRAKDLIDE